MQLKHKGKEVTVTLTTTEQRALEKARDMFAMVAMVPCGQKERAGEAVALIDELVGEMMKAGPVDDQCKLPLDDEADDEPKLPFEDEAEKQPKTDAKSKKREK